MGTWGVGPFDNDTAADFAIALDEAEMGEREVLIRSALLRTANATGYLSEAQQAVAVHCADRSAVYGRGAIPTWSRAGEAHARLRGGRSSAGR